jgi:GNAT superfamily N-acetyltransferase
MSYRLELIDTSVAPEATLEALHDFYVKRDSWDLPDEPPMPYAQRLVNWRSFGEGIRRIPRWLLWDEAMVVASSGVVLEEAEDNRENVWGLLNVLPEYRGRGVSRQVLTPMLDAAEGDRRLRIAGGIKVGDSSSGFAEKAGLAPVYLERESRLVLAEVDREMVRDWIDRASERASDYELLMWVGPIPKEHLGGFVELTHIMNTAPLDDMVEEDFIMTPERWRSDEEGWTGRGMTNFTSVARHIPSGEFAGYSNVLFQRFHPEQAQQGDTGVDPAHRNKGLGRWMKAEMIERLVQDHPEIRWINTENAESNKPMLDINIALGFKPHLEIQVWQGLIPDVRAGLNV